MAPVGQPLRMLCGAAMTRNDSVCGATTAETTMMGEGFWMETITLAGGIIVFALAIAVYAVFLQRRAMATQTSAVSKTLPAQQEGLAIGRESLELQRETNRLLAVIAKALERQ